MRGAQLPWAQVQRPLGAQGPSEAALNTRAHSQRWVRVAGVKPEQCWQQCLIRAQQGAASSSGQSLLAIGDSGAGQRQGRLAGGCLGGRPGHRGYPGVGTGPAAGVRSYGGSCGGGGLPVAEGCPGRTCCPGEHGAGSGILPGCRLHPTLAYAFFSAQRCVLCDHGWGPALSGPPTGCPCAISCPAAHDVLLTEGLLPGWAGLGQALLGFAPVACPDTALGAF